MFGVVRKGEISLIRSFTRFVKCAILQICKPDRSTVEEHCFHDTSHFTKKKKKFMRNLKLLGFCECLIECLDNHRGFYVRICILNGFFLLGTRFSKFPPVVHTFISCSCYPGGVLLSPGLSRLSPIRRCVSYTWSVVPNRPQKALFSITE